MNINKYQSKTESETKEYEFLKDIDKSLTICYLVASGSHGYGTSNENSDIDLRGFCIGNKRQILGFEKFEQYENTDTDTVIYSLNKFLELCLNSNPNVIELLGVDEQEIIMMNDAGRLIRNNADLFLSKRAANSFGNYAKAQLRRLKNALCHDQYNDTEKTKHLHDVLNTLIEYFHKRYKIPQNSSFKIYLQDDQIFVDLNMERFNLHEFIGLNSEIKDITKTFNRLNHRHNKKDQSKLFKHAMHLIRLLLTGKDILDGKGIITKRTAEHELLMNIRSGKYSYDKIFELADSYMKQLDISIENTKLPDMPDYRAVEDMQIRIYEEYIFSSAAIFSANSIIKSTLPPKQ